MKILRQGFVGALAVVGLALVFGSLMAYAQDVGQRVSGTVVDPTGARIPGVKAALRNDASGAELRTTTDSSGFYLFDYVPVATYTLTVSATGFKSYVQTNITIHPGLAVTADVTLQIGTKVETVEVVGTAVNLIPKSSGAVVPVIDSQQIQNSGTIGRDALELLTLLPGVVGGTGIPGSWQNGGFDPTGGSGFQVGSGSGVTGMNSFNINGLRNDQNVIKLDNAYAMDPGENGGFVVEPNMDMISEFSVKMSGFEASQGGAGVIVNAITKSGGSSIHGEGYYYGRNAFLNANDWSNNEARIPKPASKFNYPGFNVGGPVRFPGTDFNKHNDKMFFFYGVEWQRQLADQGTHLATVPSANMLNGNFNELLNTKFCQSTGGVVTGGNYLSLPCVVDDIATGAQANYGGVLNQLPPNEVTTDGQIILKGNYLLPNYYDPTGGTNFAGHPMYPENRIENNIRIDYNLTQNTRAYLRLAQNSDHEYYPYGLWLGAGGFGSSPNVTPVVGHDKGESATVNVVSVINPTLTNEVQVTANGIWYPYKYANPALVSSTQLQKDLPGLNWNAENAGAAPVYTRTAQVPLIWDSVDTAQTQTWGQGDLANGVFGDKTIFEAEDNLTKVQGTHTLQFGFSVNHTRNDQNQAGVQGTIWDQPGWAGGSTGNIFGDLLAQHVTWWNQSTNDPDGMWRFTNYEWYGQDSWKVNRKLTLNYGIRFAYMPPWYEARGEVAAFNPHIWTAANDSSAFDGVQVGSGIKLVENTPYFPKSYAGLYTTGLPSSGGFPSTGVWYEPRIGFAYDLRGNGKTVVRAGYGVYTERDQGNTIFGAAQQPPFEFSTSQTSVMCNITRTCAGGASGFAAIEQINPFSSVGGIAATDYDQNDHHGAQSYSYNFTVDQDIGWKTILEAGYVGTVGRHLYVENIIPADAIPLGALWCGSSNSEVSAANCKGVTSGLLGLGTASNTNAYRLYQPFGTLDMLHHVSTSNYNSLQVTVRRNVTHGLTLLSSYTYSKTLGYGGAYNSSVDVFNSRLNYGLQSYDRPQMFNISYIYQLPNAGTKYFSGNKVAGGVLNGWQLSGITNFQSGAPLSVSNGTISCSQATANGTNTGLCAANTGNTETWSGSDLTWYGTPDRALNPMLMFNPQKGGVKGVNKAWLNPASITLPQINQAGTYEMPQFLGPGSYNFDLTLFKTFKLTEHTSLEFRAAAFDIFNRAQLDNPVTTTANMTWDLPANATSYSQGSASPVTNVPSSGNACTTGNFGCVVDKHGHREMEFAVKLHF